VRPPHFYLQAHIPGAVNVPGFLLSGTETVLSAGSVAARLGRVGATRDHHIVAYDDGGSPSAAFLWRILSYYRHPSASVLNGGITRWRREGKDVEYVAESPAPAHYAAGEPDSSSLASLEDVQRAIESGNTVIVDVRSPAEYLGLRMTEDRSGHIPGAVNVEWSNNFAPSPQAIRIHRTQPELASLYKDAGVTADKNVILYCGSGHRVSETFMVLKMLRHPRVAIYLPGWHEWGNNRDLPVEK
jgi:thiosulfate/3-mercaptopyruvate sulfurtransferase